MKKTIPSIKRFSHELYSEIISVSYTLYKIMVPTIIIVKVVEELGGVKLLAIVLGPLMALIGLPDSMGLVWAATLCSNIYAGMLVFFSQSQQETLTVAQVTVLGSLLLLAHGLPIEARVAQIAGVRLGATLLLRLGGSILCAWLLHCIYSQGEYLQQTNQLLWQPEISDNNLSTWLINQLKSFTMIQLIIIALLTFLKLLRNIGIERLIAFLLQPLLKLLGIGKEATTITIVGVTLGLSFGGGLLIKEAHAGHISKRDVFASMSFLGLCHSVIEDTLLVMLLGAHVSGILWMRLVFTLIVIGIMTRWMDHTSTGFQQRFLFRRLS